jgi:hypothetical protein
MSGAMLSRLVCKTSVTLADTAKACWAAAVLRGDVVAGQKHATPPARPMPPAPRALAYGHASAGTCGRTRSWSAIWPTTAAKKELSICFRPHACWQQGIPARIVLAGPEMPSFRTFFEKFSSEPVTRSSPPAVRLGVLDEGQKKDFFAGLDVFALPSGSDSFGLVLLEAWANGVPNIAYRAGGIADVIQHDTDGLLVPCGKIEALADGHGLEIGLYRLCDRRQVRASEASDEKSPARSRAGLLCKNRQQHDQRPNTCPPSHPPPPSSHPSESPPPARRWSRAASPRSTHSAARCGRPWSDR